MRETMYIPQADWVLFLLFLFSVSRFVLSIYPKRKREMRKEKEETEKKKRKRRKGKEEKENKKRGPNRVAEYRLSRARAALDVAARSAAGSSASSSRFLN